VPSVADPPPESSIPGLAVRSYRSRGLQQVDLFWTGSPADAFDVYRDGRRIAIASASGYTDRLGRDGSGSYRYRVGVTGTDVRSNEATVTFAAGRRVVGADATSNREPSHGAAVSVSAVGMEEPFRHRATHTLSRPCGTGVVVTASANRAHAIQTRKGKRAARLGDRRVALRRSARFVCIVALVLCLPATAAPASPVPSPVFQPPQAYYLALGDSIAYGFQLPRWLAGLPPAGFDTGYVDVFGAALREIRPHITTVNYGCPGESTVSFIAGPCAVRQEGVVALHDDFDGSQLDAAVAFLRAHDGRVSPITLHVGGNDVRALLTACNRDFGCLQAEAPAAIAQFGSRLGTILARLRAAAPNAEIIVSGQYDPFLGFFAQADPLYLALNDAIATVAAAERARYADIFPAFNPQGDREAEAAAMCLLTLLCSDGDDHPSDVGYRALAAAVFDSSGYARLAP
jgi:lysophospholipase L1-like esterase